MATQRSGNARVFGAALGGAIVGAIAASLLTPMSGPAMRRELRALVGDTQKIPDAVEKASGAASKAFKKSLKEKKKGDD